MVPAAARGPVARAIAASHGAVPIHGYELTDPAGQANEYFGSTVAVSGDTLVVGVTEQVNSGVGLAYVFHRPATGWAHVRMVATLTPTDGVGGDEFGDGVAISGSTIAVAAAYRTVAGHARQGAVYVFSMPAAGWRGTLHESADLTASDGLAGDYLGYQGVAISGRVLTAAGSYHTVDGQVDQGAIYVFVEPASGWHGVRHESAELTASDGANSDYLGYGAVGISGRTVTAASGSHVGSATDEGAVYVWVEPKAGWSGKHHESAELIASDSATGDEMGYQAVGISGDTVVAGAGRHAIGSHPPQGEVYVWQRPKAGWSGTRHESARLVASDGEGGDDLGKGAVAISGDTVFATAQSREVGTNVQQGAGYVFLKPAHGWSGTRTQTSEVTAPHGEASDSLGADNDLAVFGTTLVAGAPDRTVGTNTDQGVAVVFSPPRPSLSGLKVSRIAWRAGSRRAVLNPAHRPKGGTRFSFSLNEVGPVTVRFTKHAHGHSTKAGHLTVNAPSGHNALYFFGQLRTHHVLSSGTYSASFSTANPAGTSVSRRVRFAIIKP